MDTSVSAQQTIAPRAGATAPRAGGCGRARRGAGSPAIGVRRGPVRADHGENPPLCAPDVHFLGFSEALNKTTFGGFDVAELSGLTYDPQADLYTPSQTGRGDPGACVHPQPAADRRRVR